MNNTKQSKGQKFDFSKIKENSLEDDLIESLLDSGSEIIKNNFNSEENLSPNKEFIESKLKEGSVLMDPVPKDFVPEESCIINDDIFQMGAPPTDFNLQQNKHDNQLKGDAIVLVSNISSSEVKTFDLGILNESKPSQPLKGGYGYGMLSEDEKEPTKIEDPYNAVNGFGMLSEEPANVVSNDPYPKDDRDTKNEGFGGGFGILSDEPKEKKPEAKLSNKRNNFGMLSDDFQENEGRPGTKGKKKKKKYNFGMLSDEIEEEVKDPYKIDEKKKTIKKKIEKNPKSGNSNQFDYNSKTRKIGTEKFDKSKNSKREGKESGRGKVKNKKRDHLSRDPYKTDQFNSEFNSRKSVFNFLFSIL